MTTELLRSSFDVDGTRVELLWDEQRFRFTVATRWINLAHLGCSLPTDGNKALALAQASATFEAVCMDGATWLCAECKEGCPVHSSGALHFSFRL